MNILKGEYKMIIYNLYVNGVLYDKFKTIKEIDEFIFEKRN